MKITKVNNIEQELVNKLKQNFTETEQQMFIQSFSMYLNHNQESEYIINLDDVYKWIGFEQKVHCKRLLLKHFQENIDYKITMGSSKEEAALPVGRAASSSKNLGGAGLNKETILMNIKTFKKLCMKASTKKADEIHDYYIKMETILQEYIHEKMETEKKQIKETTLLESYDNKKVLYLLWINEFLLKFGWSDNINQRLSEHKTTYGNQSKLIYVTECKQNKLLETHMKQHNDINSSTVSKVFNKKCRTELIDTSKITTDQVIKIIEFLKDKLLQDFEIFQMEHLERMKYEDTKQKEEDTKQKQIELEIKKLEYELEIRKLELQSQLQKSVVLIDTLKPEIPIKKVIKKKWNVKSQLHGSDEEKVKFRNWLDLNVIKSENDMVAWSAIISKYITKTSPLIKSIYKDYFEEYISEKYDITELYKSIRVNRTKTIRGWNNLKLKENKVKEI